MPLEVLDAQGANTIAKTPFDKVIEFIAAECDECAENLPESYKDQPGQQIGRVTRGFALAVKSKALLYAASPLHNPDGDNARWLASARAALDIINSGAYVLEKTESANNIASKETVMMVIGTDNSNFELNNFPIRFTEGKRSGATATFPSQNLVDAFETVNGYSVTLTDIGWKSDDPDFDPAYPYSGRDPRFYRSILANGMSFKGSVIEVWEGGRDCQEVISGDRKSVV